MNKQLFRVSALGILVLLAITSGYAQSPAPMYIKVPFQFTAAATAFPAGDYTVSRLLSPARTVLIRSVDCSKAAIVLTLPAESSVSKNSRLEFHRYGNQYFLANIWTVGDSIGSELIKSRAERELEKGVSNREMVTLIGHANR